MLLKLIVELVWMQGISLGVSLCISQIFKFHYSWGKNTLLQLCAINTQALRSRCWFICQQERSNVLCGMWAWSRSLINNSYQSNLSVCWYAMNCSSRDAYGFLTRAFSKRTERGRLRPTQMQLWNIFPLDTSRLFFSTEIVKGRLNARPSSQCLGITLAEAA